MAVADRIFFVSLRALEEGRHNFQLVEPGFTLDLSREGFSVTSDVRLDLTLDKIGSLLTARGVVSTLPEMTCARCLEPYETELITDFEVVIRMGQDDFRLEDDEDTQIDFRDDGVSFTPSVRESLILAIPIKPLCNEECRGLCPRCGTNLNLSSCDCPEESDDPRWDDLKILLEEK